MNSCDQAFDGGLVQPDQRGHAVALWISALHQFATQRDQPQRIGEIQRACDHRRRISTDGQTCNHVGDVVIGHQHPRTRDAGDQQTELNSASRLQGGGGVQRQDVHVQRRARFCQALRNQRVLRQTVEHARLLRTLAGKCPEGAHAATA